MTNLYSRLRACFPADNLAPFARTSAGLVTYADVEAGSARYAHALGRLGAVCGDRLVVQTEKSIEMLLLYLGCLRAGVVFLPLNTAYTPAEVDYFVSDAEPSVIVCDAATVGDLAGLPEIGRARIISLHGENSLAQIAASCPDGFDTVERAEDDLAAILYTSGTTGRSKGAMLSHDNLASNAFALRRLWEFTQDDVLLHALPIFHTHGLFVATNVILSVGASMIFQERFDVDAVLTALPQATVMMGVPTFYSRLLDDARLTRELAAGMRLFISGSAPLPADVHRAFEKATGHAILERYGMTETNMNSSNPLHGERVPGTVGFPIPGVDIRIAHPETGAPLAVGEVGAIEVRGPNVFKGYWRMPEKTASEFRGGYFVTGDLGKFDERGYLSIVGREKDLIIAGGFNIYPAEVENAIADLEAVREVAVIGVPHADLGEAVVAVVVPARPGQGDPQAISDALAGTLARFKQPREIVFVDELPKNAMGKIQKGLLRESCKDLFRIAPAGQ